MTYTVTLDPSGKQFEADEDDTLLDAALHHGINLPYGCRNGACGECKARIQSGEVDLGEYKPHALPDEDKDAGYALLCQAHAESDLVVEAYELGDPRKQEVRRLPARVHDFHKVTHDIMEVQLKLPEADRLQYLAGQYVEVILNDGRRRAFSIANTPFHDEVLTLHIRHVPGGQFTEHIFGAMQKKEIWNIEGPLGNFYLRASDRPALLLAGGTGLGPIKAILETAFEEGVDRDFHLFFGARTQSDLYLTATLDAWQEAHPNFRWTPVLSQPAADDDWRGETGHLHEAIPRHYADLAGHEGYLAGPPPMVEATTETLKAQGMAGNRIFSDAFTYSAE